LKNSLRWSDTLQPFDKKVLAADFSKYPGDIRNFDDCKLQDEGLLEGVKTLEKRFEKNFAFESLEQALIERGVQRVERQLRYRWFCLLWWQNVLRAADTERLKRIIEELVTENIKLRDELSEGTGDLILKHALQGTIPTDDDMEQARQDWRARKENEKAETQRRHYAELERQRIRSGRPGVYRKDIDWTQPHTAQEYVDAFCQESIHAKSVRIFLHPFATLRKRRGCGANKSFEYPFEAGLRLYEKAITDWIAYNDVRIPILFTDIMKQLILPSAISPAGFRCREMLSRLAERFLCGQPSSVFISLRVLVSSDEIWAGMHKFFRKRNLGAELLV
jgi:hypothetical protein